jgi:hypothetical protein
MNAASGNFAHRHAGTDRFESICLQCFRTAGSAAREESLAEVETQHVCEAEDLLKVSARMQPVATTPAGQRKGMA